MKVLVLAPAIYDTAPGQRFRIEQWARYLERDGLEFRFAPFETEGLHRVLYAAGQYGSKSVQMLKALARRFTVLGSLKNYDVVYVPREAALIGPAVIERLVTMLGLPLVYDFDDPIWLGYRSPKNGFFSRLKFSGKTTAICRMATRVITGNRLLAEWARQHAAIVDVVPSTVDLEQYPAKNHQISDRPLTLGWTGSHSTLPFLETLSEPLRKLIARRQFQLLVVSHTDSYRWDSLPIKIVSQRWVAANEGIDMQQMDIGLGPFPNTGWTPWRCHGKVLQYMAAGIPCVVSSIGILPDYIDDGVNGFLASSDLEWVEKLEALIDNVDLRRRMGHAARRTIEQRYSATVWAPRVKEILEAAVSCSRRKARSPTHFASTRP